MAIIKIFKIIYIEISKKFSCTPEEAAVRLYETSEGSFVLHSMEEQDLEEIAKSDYISIASDGNSLRSTGPLSSGKPHPRSYATNTRFLENIVRDKKLVSIGKAIWRMTGLPAQRLGLKNRGSIEIGNYADLNIFKINEIKEHASYIDPHKYSTGMKNVILNGKIAVENGVKTKGRYGRVIRSVQE